ncbi:hypothetical protein [Thermodesulfovibrio hydrogeniphilus]
MHQFGPLISDVWTDIHRIRSNKRRDEYPCQLTIHLLERLLLMSSEEGDIVSRTNGVEDKIKGKGLINVIVISLWH